MSEPVAWMVYSVDGTSVRVTDNPTEIRDGEKALPLYTEPYVNTRIAEQDELIEQFGTAVTDMFEQLENGNWVDDHGHDVRMNLRMQALQPVVQAAIDLRAKYGVK